MPTKALVMGVSDVAALASVLKNARARKAFQTALKKGKSPTLSLTAAVSASLVSAAAKEEEFDPLAGLVAVDDLSAFGEDCLPGLNYEDRDEHDHDALSANDDHRGHLGYSSYLADPFVSRFANQYARDHAEHGDHDRRDALTADHSAHGPEVGHGAQHAAAHSGHQQGSQSHQHHDVAASGQDVAGGEHASGWHHQPGAMTRHAAHSAHEDGHDMTAHEAAGHSRHNTSADANSHAGHAAPQANLPEMEEFHTEHGAENGEDDVIDLDQGIDALAEENHGAHDVASADDAAEPATSGAPEEHSHHHGVTLADLDAPPADDLAVAQPLPVI